MKDKKHTTAERLQRLETVATQLYLTNAAMNERLIALETKNKKE